MSAWTELQDTLRESEFIISICFGAYGWGSLPADLDKAADRPSEEFYGFNEENLASRIPWNKRAVLLSPEEAEPLMNFWSFYGGYGAPEAYATYIWTNERVIWVTQYDGATGLSSMPRHPEPCTPNMPGG